MADVGFVPKKKLKEPDVERPEDEVLGVFNGLLGCRRQPDGPWRAQERSASLRHC